MKINNTLIIIIFLIVSFNCAYAQSYFGVTGGLSKATFFDTSKDDNYDVKYKLGNGQVLCLFFEIAIDSISNVRAGLQYNFQETGIEVMNYAGNSSFYKNIDYQISLISFNLDYVISAFKNDRINLACFFGPILHLF